jgi:hypothetical protein
VVLKDNIQNTIHFLFQNANVENKIVRKQGYEVNPLHLDMTAHLKPAL